jgi:tetratricopeptide (TPR) repeat protein
LDLDLRFDQTILVLTGAYFIAGCGNTACILASKDGFDAQRKGDLPRAESCFKKAVQACKGGGESSTLADSETNLARVYFAEKKYALAAPLLEDVRRLWTRFPPRADDSRVALLNMLGQSEQELKKYVEAESVLNEALTKAQNESGDNGPDIAKTLVALGGLYKVQAKWARALDAYQRGEAILNRSANISSQARATLDSNIAEVSKHVAPAKAYKKRP